MIQNYEYAEQILQLVPNGLAIADRDRRILVWNPELVRITGYAADDVIGRDLLDIFPDLTPLVKTLWEELQGKGKLQQLEVSIRHRDGHIIPLEFSSTLLQDATEKSAVVTILVRELAAQKRREALLTALNDAGKAAALARTSTQVFDAMAGELQKLGLRTAILLLDEAGENLQLKHVTLRPGELDDAEALRQSVVGNWSSRGEDSPIFQTISQTGHALFVSTGGDRAGDTLWQAFQEQLTLALQAYEKYQVNIDHAIFAPLWHDDRIVGEIVVEGGLQAEDAPAIGIFAHQLSAALTNARMWESLEQRVIERTAELQTEQERLNAILVHMADAVIFTDADERIVYVNPAWERLNGYELAEVQGQRPAFLTAAQTPGEILDDLRASLRNGQRWQGELLNLRKDGSTYETEMTIVPVADESGQVRYHVGVNRDITEDKQFLRVKDQFVSDMSHELRTPLTNIKFYLSLLERGDPSRTDHYMGTLKRETNRLQDIMEDLLSLSRLDQERIEFQMAPTDLNMFLTTLVAEHQSAAADRDLILTFAPEPSLPTVMIDQTQMTQAITNLLLNAIYYTLAGGTVQVATGVENVGHETWVKIALADTGLGIVPEDQERLFERFFRGQASRTTNTPGTGLGLALCFEIVQRHRGRIDVVTEPEVGSTFAVYLPVA